MLDFFAGLPNVAGAHVATILGLIFLDLMLGIGQAIRSGEFYWGEVASFYRSNVLPYLFGFIGVVGALTFVSVDLLPANVAEALPVVASWLGFGTIASNIFASVVRNAKALISGVPKWALE